MDDRRHRGRFYLNPRLRQNDTLGQRVEVRYHEHHTHLVEVFVAGEHVCTAYESHAQTQNMRMGVVAARQSNEREFGVLKRAADYQNALDERERQIDDGVLEHALPALPPLTTEDRLAIQAEGVDLSTFMGNFRNTPEGASDPDIDHVAEGTSTEDPPWGETAPSAAADEPACVPESAPPSTMAQINDILKGQTHAS